jgi:hypothetical protein
MQLKTFSIQQGADFLLCLPENRPPPSQMDKNAAGFIFQCFGGLPLGHRQAAYFMRNRKCLHADFLDLYDQKHDEIEKLHVPGYTKTVSDV